MNTGMHYGIQTGQWIVVLEVLSDSRGRDSGVYPFDLILIKT